MCVQGKESEPLEREREREKNRQTDRQTDRQTERERKEVTTSEVDKFLEDLHTAAGVNVEAESASST